jgi:prevent-host-death family protein
MVDYIVQTIQISRVPIIVNVHEAKAGLSALLDRAHEGEEIIVAKAGKPWARLVPLQPDQPRQAGKHPELAVGESIFEPLPDDELEAWE